MPPAFEVLLLNTAIPQIQAAQSGDTYVVPRDIAFSAALTLSAGTANGVPYLNGSKVLTSGSALTFDGTNLATTGGVNSDNTSTLAKTAGQSLVVGNLAAAGAKLDVQTASGTAATFRLFQNGISNFVLSVPANTDALTFLQYGSSELMRLTSTGLGIGTSSPGYKLQVVGTSQLSLSGAGTQQALQLNNNDTTAGTQAVKIGFSSSSVTKASINAAVYGNDYMTFNVGSDTERARISSDGTFRVKGAGTAGTTDAVQFSGSAPASAMTLDASGNLGIGETNPTTRLHTSIARAATITSAIFGTTGTGVVNDENRLVIKNINTASGQNYGVGIGGLLEASASNKASLLFYTDSGTATTERARITSGGELLVGAPAGLPVANGLISASSASASVIPIRAYCSAGDAYAALSVDKSSTTNTTSQVFAIFTINAQAAGSGQINANGASQAAFGSFSDRRLKENIVDLESQWQNIKSLRPVEFDYVANEGGGHQIGFIAQEVQTAYPDLVGERSDGMLTLSGMGKNEARLIKALQEAMARIEKLEAEVAALKGA